MKEDETIRISTGTPYDVKIGENLLSRAGEEVKKVLPSAGKIALISDETVYALYGEKAVKSLQGAGFLVNKYVIRGGETDKTADTYLKIAEFLAENRFTRADALFALGGGVVGDLTGFVAATYQRGVSYVQAPTTLLAAIDSSVGGKTGIDLLGEKNYLGAFWQPALVLCDTSLLQTLSAKEIAADMGEAAKYALLSERVYKLLKKNDVKSASARRELIKACVEYKKEVVEADERDLGERRLLNLGHTAGHAAEKLSGLALSHGEAVGMGLRILVSSARRRGNIDAETEAEIFSALGKFMPVCPYGADLLAEAAASDKKRRGDDITVVDFYGVGDCRLKTIAPEDLEEFFS